MSDSGREGYLPSPTNNRPNNQLMNRPLLSVRWPANVIEHQRKDSRDDGADDERRFEDKALFAAIAAAALPRQEVIPLPVVPRAVALRLLSRQSGHCFQRSERAKGIKPSFWYVVFLNTNQKEIHCSTGLRTEGPNETAKAKALRTELEVKEHHRLPAVNSES